MSVGMIGGADGPTVVFVAGNPWAAAVIGAAALAVGIGLGVFFWGRRKK